MSFRLDGDEPDWDVSEESREPILIGQLIGELFSPPLADALAPDPKVVRCRQCQEHFKSTAGWLFKGWHYANLCPRCSIYGVFRHVIAKCIKPPPKHYRCRACDQPLTVAPEFDRACWLYWAECPCGNKWVDFEPLRAVCRECTHSFLMGRHSLDLICKDCREKKSSAKRSDSGEGYE